jgi:DNA-binding IclR family transcriptional regulator
MISRIPSAFLVQRALEEGPATFSELVRRTGLPAREVASALDELGRKGVVVKDEYCFELRGGLL